METLKATIQSEASKKAEIRICVSIQDEGYYTARSDLAAKGLSTLGNIVGKQCFSTVWKLFPNCLETVSKQFGNSFQTVRKQLRNIWETMFLNCLETVSKQLGNS